MADKDGIKEVAALSAMQRGMLHHALLEPGPGAHHEQLVLRLHGALDADRLAAAWQQVVDRHDALRGRFLAQRVSNPVQRIPWHEPVTLARHALPLAEWPDGADDLPPALEDYLEADLATPFQLESAHAMRLALFSGADGHWLAWSFHHILIDGWSIGLVLDEVIAACNGEPLAPAADTAPYRRWLADRDRDAALRFWQQHLAGFASEGLLATAPGTAARPGPTLQRASARVSVANTASLRSLALARAASLHHLLLCAWALTLGRYSDQRDVLVPTLLAGRPAEVPAADAMVGMFMTNVPMRVRWQPADSFAGLLQRVRDDSLQAARHQHLSLAEIQAATGPLPVDHVFVVQGLPGDDVVGRACGGARVAGVVFRETLPYTLQVTAVPGSDGIAIELRGQHPLSWLQALADAMAGLLDTVASQAGQPLHSVEPATARQRAAVLAWGDGGPPLHRGTVLQAFDTQVAREPDAPALVCDGESLDYGQLAMRANRLAHRLLADGPLAPDTPVALVARRDAHLVAGLLAILKAGAAYVPVDPDYPPERVRLMLEASGCRHALVAPGLEALLPPGAGIRLLPLDAAVDMPPTPPEVDVAPGQLAYLIFTSGSTGTPKGVMLTHANAASVLAAIPPAVGFQGTQRVLGATTVSFDISILELLGTLSWGHTLVLASADQARDPAMLLELVGRAGVTVLQATPTRLRALLEAAGAGEQAAAALASLRHVLVGGEALPPELAARLLALPLRACNVYGPTETAIWSSCWPLAPGPVRLGRALAGEKLLVLSSDRRLQPPWALGEIAIAGAGVARGYHADPERTAERFISVPGVAGTVYLTGDLGRWCDDGSLQGLGRRDEQVKVRGMRIELAEVERHLGQLPGVRAAAAALRNNAHGDPELVGYLCGPAVLDAPALRARLAALLPAPMVPTHFVLLPSLPLTPAGKTDRRALPAPSTGALPAARPPVDGPEALVTGVFAEVLGHAVGPDDDFFLAGGHSLLAIQAIGRINRVLSSGYALRDLYRAPTAAGLARLPARPGLPLLPAPAAPDHPLSAQQQALWVLQQLEPDYAGYNVPGAYLVAGTLDEARLARAWAAVVARHPALRTVFVRVAGSPRQRILERMPFTIERHALPPGADPEPLLRDITLRPFELERGPLFRLAVIALGAGRQLLALVQHHIVSDGWSDALLTADLQAAWQAQERGQDPQAALPPPPAIGYHDYAHWQQRWLASPAVQGHREFWQERLADLPLLALPASGSRSKGQERPGARIDFGLPAADADRWLAHWPAGERYAALAATTLALLHLQGGQQDLVLGLPVAHRDRPQLQEQVGLHLNMLPLRQQVDPGATLASLQQQCAGAIVEALAHADYPFACLVDDLGLVAEPGRHPVFDAMLIFHQQPVPVPALAGLQVALHPGRSYSSRFDLDFEVWAGESGVHGFLEHDAGLFSAQQAQALVDHWLALLLAGSREPAAAIAQLRAQSSPQERAPHLQAAAMALDEEF